jgi:hypothetical protein
MLNTDRMELVLNILTRGGELIAKQGKMGRELNGEACCNRNDAGHGCVVGLLVGVDQFMTGCKKTVVNLPHDKIDRILQSVESTIKIGDLSELERHYLVDIIACMQRVHDYLGNQGAGRSQRFDGWSASIFNGIMAQVAMAIDSKRNMDGGWDGPTVNLIGVGDKYDEVYLNDKIQSLCNSAMMFCTC